MRKFWYVISLACFFPKLQLSHSFMAWRALMADSFEQGEILTRCFAKGKQGGVWGIGDEKPGSQEYYEVNFPAAVPLDHIYHDTL